jgi:thiazole synthase ThiGH ThiG subunit
VGQASSSAGASGSSVCVQLLPNTAGCFTARDAVLTAKLARQRGHRPLTATLCVEHRDVSNPDAEKDGKLLTAHLTSGEM